MKLMCLTLITRRGKNSGEKLIKPKADFYYEEFIPVHMIRHKFDSLINESTKHFGFIAYVIWEKAKKVQ